MRAGRGLIRRHRGWSRLEGWSHGQHDSHGDISGNQRTDALRRVGTSAARGRRVSARVAAVAPSATLAVDAKAKALRAAGERRHRLRRRRARLPDPGAHRGGRGGRLPRPGEPPLHADRRPARAARGDRRQDREGLGPRGRPLHRCSSPTAAKQAVDNAFAVLCDPGDEVLVPAPYWTTYPEVDPPGRRGAGDGRLPTRRAASAPRSTTSRRPRPRRPRSLLFVSPSNPTGAVLPAPRRSRPSGRWALPSGLWVLTDEIYEHLVYGGRRAPLHAGAGARAGRPLPGGQRRGQDLRHDRVARRVAHRRRPTPSTRRPTSRATRRPTSSNVAQRAALAAVSGGLEDVAMMRGGVRPPAPDDRHRCSTRSTGSSAWSPRARSTPSRRSRGCSGRSLRATTVRRAARSWPRSASTRPRWRWSPERRSGHRATSGCPTRWATTTSSRV